MKTPIPLILAVICASSLLAADADPKASLLAAAKNLGGKPNYSWKTTVEVPGDPTGTIEGKTEKAGATVLVLARGEDSFDGVLKGGKGAVKTSEGWQSLSEAAAQDNGQSGAVRFVARLLQNYKAPADEVADLAGKVRELKLADDVYAGVLSEETAKELLLYRTGAGGGGPQVSGAKGSARFWIKEGALSKYELKLQGTITFNGNDRDVDRTHTTTIKDAGTTKVTVPDEAAKKL